MKNSLAKLEAFDASPLDVPGQALVKPLEEGSHKEANELRPLPDPIMDLATPDQRNLFTPISMPKPVVEAQSKKDEKKPDNGNNMHASYYLISSLHS